MEHTFNTNVIQKLVARITGDNDTYEYRGLRDEPMLAELKSAGVSPTLWAWMVVTMFDVTSFDSTKVTLTKKADPKDYKRLDIEASLRNVQAFVEKCGLFVAGNGILTPVSERVREAMCQQALTLAKWDKKPTFQEFVATLLVAHYFPARRLSDGATVWEQQVIE